jgi:hypothetical protein
MHDLLFTRPGDVYPFPAFVRVSAADGVFEFQLWQQDRLVTADSAKRQNALGVLHAFLMRLDTGSVGD